MKQPFILLFTCLISIYTFSQEHLATETTTYYLIRHAEKDRSNTTNKNPHLTEIGKERAKKWCSILQHVSLDAVYSTDYYRTKETAQPTATKKGLKLTIYNAEKLEVDSFLNSTKGKTILIVGHSDTIPHLVNSILDSKKYIDIEDSNNGNLYIITIIDGKISDQVLTFN